MLVLPLLLLNCISALQPEPRWYDDNGLYIRQNHTQPQPGDGSGAEAWLPPLLNPKISDNDTYSPEQLTPHPHHELHYLDYESSRAGHALLNLSRNGVKLEDASFVRKGSVSCSPYIYDRNYTLPFNATFQVDTDDQLEAILAWPNDTIVILWGPQSSGCSEYRHPYFILSGPYDVSDGSCEKVTVELVRAHWKDFYTSADVRLAPLSNFNNSEFGNCTDNMRKRDLARRSFDYQTSGGQTFNSANSITLYNNDGLEVKGYANLDGPYTTDVRFHLDIEFSGTTGDLRFLGTANGLTASLGVDISVQQQQFYSDSVTILSVEIAGIGIPELLVLGLTGNLDLEYRLTMSEYWGINGLGPVFTWGKDAQVELAAGYDGSYYGEVAGNNWKPDISFKPVFVGPTVALNAFAGPALALCAGLNTLDGFWNEQYCVKGALGFTAEVKENGGSCTDDNYDFNFGIGIDFSYSGPWVGTHTIWSDEFATLFDYCITNPDGPVTFEPAPAAPTAITPAADSASAEPAASTSTPGPIVSSAPVSSASTSNSPSPTPSTSSAPVVSSASASSPTPNTPSTSSAISPIPNSASASSSVSVSSAAALSSAGSSTASASTSGSS